MVAESHTVVVFDLDDTLYKEASYSQSCFRFFSRELQRRFQVDAPAEALLARQSRGESSPLQSVCAEQGLTEEQCGAIVSDMRAHVPDIALPADSASLLDTLRGRGIPYGIVTDGRSSTQRAKIQALGLTDAAIVLISEERGVSKPDERAFLPITEMFANGRMIYIADNPRKDFLAPNRLGWETVMLVDDGRNVHSQDVVVEEAYRARHCVQSLSEVVALSFFDA